MKILQVHTILILFMMAIIGVLIMIIVSLGQSVKAARARIPTAQETANVAKYNALPESAKMALMAKNLVGLTVCQKAADQPFCTTIFEILILNGAQVTNEGTADLVITAKTTGYIGDDVDVTVKYKSNIFFETISSDIFARSFAQNIANTLGTETKVDVIQKQHRQSIIDSHKRVLGF